MRWPSFLAIMLAGVLADQLGFEAQPGEYASTTDQPQKVQLTVTTSRVNGAETTSPLHVTLHGTHFSSAELPLFRDAVTGNPMMLNRGETRAEAIDVTSYNIGRLTSVELRTAGADPWRFAQLTARVGTRTYHFPRHDAWLASPAIGAANDPNTSPWSESVVLPVLRATEVALDAGQQPLP